MKRFRGWAVVLLAFFMFGCGDMHMMVDETGFGVSGGFPVTASSVAYDTEILPIFQRYCSACHNADGPLPNWLDYNVAFAKKDKIYDRVVVKKDMPMVSSMPDDQRALIAEWIKAGAPKTKQVSAQPVAPSVPPAAPDSPPSSPSEPSEPSDPGNPVMPVQPEPSAITYDEVIRPQIFEVKCQFCHNANSSLPNWLDYNVAYSLRSKIYDRVVVRKDMPLGGGMSDAERALVAQWIDAGAPKSATSAAPQQPVAPSDPAPAPGDDDSDSDDYGRDGSDSSGSSDNSGSSGSGSSGGGSGDDDCERDGRSG